MTLRTLASSILFFSLMICQCGSIIHKKVDTRMIWQKGDAYIRLFEEVGSTKGFNQPYTFYEEDMKEILLNIYFSRYQYFRWGTSARVFEEDRVRTLAPFFQQAFLDAGPDTLVEFYLPYRTSKLFGISGQTQLTQGRAFIKGNRLNFQFFNVQEPVMNPNAEIEDQVGLTPVAWKLVPQAEQRYGTDKDTLGQGREDPHWIQISLTPATQEATPAAAPAPAPVVEKKTAPPQPTAAPLPAAAPPAGQADAYRRFEELKKLLDAGMISQKDYDRKKKEILDSL